MTFKNDLNAYLALLQHEFIREAKGQQIFHICPADTWEQPFLQQQQLPQHSDDQLEDVSVNDETTSEMFKLNEDCFIHLFKSMDLDTLVNVSEVCKLFHRLCHQYCFSRFRTFELNNLHEVIKMPLRKMRRTLRCIGPHITDLKYTCNIYGDSNISSRFLETMAQHIGLNLRRAKFLDSLICENEQLAIIAPILKNLETLVIYDINHDLDYDVDFEEICPNLIELQLKINMRLIRCCKPWRRLQRLSITNNEFLNTMTFLSIVEQNPQLTCLEFDVFDPEIRLRAIANHLPMLEKLTLEAVHANLGAWNIVHLNELQHLSEINLLTLEYEHLRGIFDCLSAFVNLRHISLHAYCPEDEEEDGEQDYERSLIGLAKCLPHLEYFAIRSISITENTLVEFIRFASSLKTLHVHWCSLSPTDAMILYIVNVLKFHRAENNSTLKLFLNPSDLMEIHVKRNEDVRRHLQISAACTHFGFDNCN